MNLKQLVYSVDDGNCLSVVGILINQNYHITVTENLTHPKHNINLTRTKTTQAYKKTSIGYKRNKPHAIVTKSAPNTQEAHYGNLRTHEFTNTLHNFVPQNSMYTYEF